MGNWAGGWVGRIGCRRDGIRCHDRVGRRRGGQRGDLRKDVRRVVNVRRIEALKRIGKFSRRRALSRVRGWLGRGDIRLRRGCPVLDLMLDGILRPLHLRRGLVEPLEGPLNPPFGAFDQHADRVKVLHLLPESGDVHRPFVDSRTVHIRIVAIVLPAVHINVSFAARALAGARPFQRTPESLATIPMPGIPERRALRASDLTERRGVTSRMITIDVKGFRLSALCSRSIR